MESSISFDESIIPYFLKCVSYLIYSTLVYVGATPEERKYINVDGTVKLEAINESCNNVLKLFGDKYVKEVIKDGKDERKNTTAKVD